MKITNVETYLLDIPLKQRIISDSQTKNVTSAEFVVVRIDTDDGISGWGFNWNFTKGTRAVKVLIDDTYSAGLIGKDPLQYKAFMHDLHLANHFIGFVGAARVGLCAVELALWDIKLKLLDTTLWEYLGACKTKVKAYSTDGGWLGCTTEELIQDLCRLVDQGYDSVKVKIGLPNPRDDYDRVKSVRKALGDHIHLMLDVNTVWDLKTSIIWGKRLEEFNIRWLEEPMHPFDKTSHAKLAEQLDIPIAVGETVYTHYDYRDYIVMGAVDIIQADVMKLTGIHEWMDVAALARSYNLEMVPHTSVQYKLHVQLTAATPNATMVENCYDSIADIWEEPLHVIDGYYNLPSQPGLGVKLKDHVLRDFRIG